MAVTSATAFVTPSYVNGQGRGFGQWPLRMRRSVPRTPHVSTLINVSQCPTFGHGTVTDDNIGAGTIESGHARRLAHGSSPQRDRIGEVCRAPNDGANPCRA
jgi:hypothetical protein